MRSSEFCVSVGPHAGADGTFGYGVGAGLVPARRGGPKNTAPPGESVRPGGVPRGDRPSWAFELGWVSGGEEIAIFPSRVSFLFGSFSLDKQRERSSVSAQSPKRTAKPRAVPRG